MCVGGEPIQILHAPHRNGEGEGLEGDKKKAPEHLSWTTGFWVALGAMGFWVPLLV
jgi:hypothetical protein